MKHNLSIMAIFKNETHILDEWICHYLYHGVDHFYLLDNDSTDDPCALLSKYGNKITYLRASGCGIQLQAYNQNLERLRAETEWVGVFDLDEFAFSTKGRKLPEILAEFQDRAVLVVPWIMFGSSGHRQQPARVVDSFVRRMSRQQHTTITKAFANMRFIREFGVHYHRASIEQTPLLSNRVPASGSPPCFAEVGESVLPSYELRMNHYRVQSWEFFSRVKMTRGDSAYPDFTRGDNDFNANDTNEVEDVLLKEINAPLRDPEFLERFIASSTD